MDKVWSTPPEPLSLSSTEKGQVDDAICGLRTTHKTASLCTQRPSIITVAIQMQMTSACQNAVRAAQSALLAHADHVAISCPENPCSVFIYILWGVQRPHGLNSVGELLKFIAFVVWDLEQIDPTNVVISNFMLNLFLATLCSLSENFYAWRNFGTWHLFISSRIKQFPQ